MAHTMRSKATNADSEIPERCSCRFWRGATRRLVMSVASIGFFVGLCESNVAANGTDISLDDPTRVSRLAITVNKSDTIRFSRAFGEALVASAEFADVTPLTDRTLYIIGKKIGQTRLTVLDKDKHLLRIIDVEIGFDLPALRKALHDNLPLARIHATSMNGHVMLAGTVPDAPTQASALSIAEQYAPGAISNSMSVRSSQQVLLEVRFVEVDRTAARDLGLNWDVVLNRFVGATGAGAPGLAGIPSGAAPFGAALVSLLSNGQRADLIIQALEKRGLAHRLAEPNLVTLSGDTANFLAGGEFPYPVAQSGTAGAAGTVTIEFKRFGIGLAFTPTVLAEGQINLKIEPEVSDIDPTHTFTYGGGITVPGLVVRRANTTVEMRDGQSFAIAGLLDNKHSTDQNQLPWVGQVPVLGALFRSASYLKNETDLVIIVTPHLVKPAVPGEKLATPFDQKVAGNDVDFFLLGRAERDKKHAVLNGHILDVDGSEAWRLMTTVEAATAGGDHARIK